MVVVPGSGLEAEVPVLVDAPAKVEDLKTSEANNRPFVKVEEDR